MSAVSSNFSRISFPQFSPLVADEVHKITQVLHFQACFLAPIEEKWLVLSDSSAPAHQKHWWFCRYLCSCQVKETFRTTSLMIYKIKYICLGSTWFVHDGYAVSFVTILLVFIQKKGHCFDKIVILLNIWKQWMYIMLGHSTTHWDLGDQVPRNTLGNLQSRVSLAMTMSQSGLETGNGCPHVSALKRNMRE